MCNPAVDSYVDSLEYVPECIKIQEMCDRAFDIHPSVMQFVPEWFKTQEMCDKADDTCLFVFNFIPGQYKTKKKCVMKLFPKIHLCLNIFLIDINFKKCLIKLLRIFYQH